MSDPTTLNLEPGTLNSASPNSVSPSPPPPISPSKKLPPTERDFEIYDAIHIDGSSTRCQAKQHEISQTRVRQIIRRVVEWLGEVLPPQTKIAKEQETRLARQIAADRFQRQFEQINQLWKATLESKFASIRIRLTTAQARLGAVGGLIDGLAADAIEGLPVPVWQPPADTAESQSEICNPKSAIPPNPLFPPPGYIPKNRPGPIKEMPQVLWDPLYEHEITPEIVAARAAWGCPISPDWIKRLQDQGKYPKDDSPSPDTAAAQSAICNPQSEVPSPPPPGDCSPSNDNSADCEPSAQTSPDVNHDSLAICNNESTNQNDSEPNESTTSQPLLTTPANMPVTVIQITPNHPTATCSPAPDPRLSSPDNLQNRETVPDEPAAAPQEVRR